VRDDLVVEVLGRACCPGDLVEVADVLPGLLDDCFFNALFQLGILRDRTRAAEIAARYPGGRMPDGGRIVIIDQAA
jgi:hypothetical protein